MYEFFDEYQWDRHLPSSEYILKKYTNGLSVYNHFNPLVIKEISEGGLCTDMETAERRIETYDADYFGAINSFLYWCFSNEPFELLFNSIAGLYDTLKNCLPGYQYKDLISFKKYYANCRIYGSKNLKKSVWLDYIGNHIVGIVLPVESPSPFTDKLSLEIANMIAADTPLIPFKNDKKKKLNGIIEAACIKNKDDNSEIFPYLPGRPKDLLCERFNGRERVEMEKVGTMGLSNPFREMLNGDIKDDTFDRANECLEDKHFNELYEQLFENNTNHKTTLPDEIALEAINKSASIAKNEPEKIVTPFVIKPGRPRKEKILEWTLKKIADIPENGWVVCEKKPFRLLCLYFFSKKPSATSHITAQALNKKFRTGQMAKKAMRWSAKNNFLKNFIVLSEPFLKELRERFERAPETTHRGTCKWLCSSIKKRKDFIDINN